MIQDFAKILEKAKAEVAILSTYDFDPLYFENRLLRKNTLNEARRILIFMDNHCYEQLGKGDIVPRYLNERYLLVPVKTSHGVFHPKLHLVVGNNGARVICGSNNLTQPGSIHNLELFNVLNIDLADSVPNNNLAFSALNFFNHCIDLSEGSAGTIAKQWLDDLAIDYVWLDSDKISSESHNKVELVHTFGDSPWDWLVRTIEGREPRCISVISPFYDKDLRLLRRIRNRWPEIKIKIFAQQQSSNLQGKELVNFEEIVLFDLEIPNSRRLHAKLIAVEFENENLILSGSCNFTTAAFDGRNVEAALSITAPKDSIENFFPDDVSAVRINAKDFISGRRDEPEAPGDNKNVLRIWSATLNKSGLLKFKYKVQVEGDLQELNLLLKVPGEKEPRRSVQIPKDPANFRDIQLTKGELSELPHAALFCRLECLINGKIIKSSVSWIIHEHRLTRQIAGSKGGKNREKVIRETGQGLTAYLDALGKREGQKAVTELLQHLNIRFQGGIRPAAGSTPRPPSPKDPTISQTPPKWSKQYSEEFETAVFDFVKRHHKSILQRHARAGNLNGLENFLDVFSSCNKLMFINCERQLIKPLHAMNWFFAGLYCLTLGGELLVQEKKIEGFIGNIIKALSGNFRQVKKVLNSYAVSEQAAFVLIAAQQLHMINVRDGNDITKSLPGYAEYTKMFFDRIHQYPDQEQFKVVLRSYGIDNADEQDRWWYYLSAQNLV